MVSRLIVTKQPIAMLLVITDLGATVDASPILVYFQILTFLNKNNG